MLSGHQTMVLWWYLVPGSYHDDTSGGNLVMLPDWVPGFMHSSTGMTAPAQCCWGYLVLSRQVYGTTRLYIHTQLTASTSDLATGISLPFP